MSSLWTPGGEHPVEPTPTPAAAPSEPAASAPAAPAGQGGPEGGLRADGLPSTVPGPDGEPISVDDLTPEQRAQLEAQIEEMAAVRAQLSETPANVVVANHVMGLYELAAIHLSENPPNFSEASIAIDALAAIVEKLSGRLGDHEADLVDAKNQLQQAFVALKQQAAAPEA